ncbi:NAD(P)-dependent oxidoreductase [Amycolatopsis sp. EV170708-02-1]|uniref:NAD(P)-dependent oxidoreductase n=1 Tax=Amycolatopsis sp. EV170708-02-1 TaxID=2919322 RepID=UPI001F0BADBF|nr:NAD(P)-binding domain-containing protein [Amycolatopsis sp. EV170708-02-1]UMO99945.1 NAD(P)-binding domain-containing protein [Amycolatopsis sp. EV170708-02-1]
MSEQDALDPVTVVGLGAMGKALAAALLKAGHRTTVWNRSAAKADTLVADGAVRADSITEAVTASPVVIVCLLDYEVTRDVLATAADALSGRLVVNLSNGTPNQARETAVWAAGHGAEYLDGGIMAVPPMIGRPEALVLYSGSQPAFDHHQDMLGRLGDSRYLGTDAGLASLYDLALLSAMYGQAAGARHALALIATERADLPEFTSSLLIPWLTAMTIGLPALAEQNDAVREAEDPVSPESMQAVAIANIAEASTGQGVDGELLSHLLVPLRDLIGHRGTGHDLPGLIDLARKAAL